MANPHTTVELAARELSAAIATAKLRDQVALEAAQRVTNAEAELAQAIKDQDTTNDRQRPMPWAENGEGSFP